jgi:hypothetical protein
MRRLWAWAMWLCFLMSALVVSADQGGNDGFEPYKPPPLEAASVEAVPLVVGAYISMWVLALLYVLFLWRQQKSIHADIELLQKKMASQSSDHSSGSGT